MDAYVCTIAGSKGGVGRTTTAINIVTVFEEGGYEAVLVDADPGMANVVKKLAVDPDATLHDVLEELRERFDVVLIDTSPTLSHELAVPLGLADGTLLVSTPDSVALTDAGRTADLADRVDGNVFGLALTRVTEADQTEVDTGDLDAPLLGVVPEDDEAAGDEPLVKTAEGRPAAAAYRDLTTVLIRGLEAGEMPEDDDETGGGFSIFG